MKYVILAQTGIQFAVVGQGSIRSEDDSKIDEAFEVIAGSWMETGRKSNSYNLDPRPMSEKCTITRV
jgi:hypothetical protein